MVTEERSLRLLIYKLKRSSKSWNIRKTFIMEKFEGENLIHLAGKKKKKSFWSFDFFDHLPLSVKIRKWLSKY